MGLFDRFKQFFRSSSREESHERELQGFETLTFVARKPNPVGYEHLECDGAQMFATDQVNERGKCRNRVVTVAHADTTHIPALGESFMSQAFCESCAKTLMPDGATSFEMICEIDTDELNAAQLKDRESRTATRDLLRGSGSRSMLD